MNYFLSEEEYKSINLKMKRSILENVNEWMSECIRSWMGKWLDERIRLRMNDKWEE